VKKWSEIKLKAASELISMSVQQLTDDIEELLIKGTQAKEILYVNANSREEAENVLAFVKELLRKQKQSKYEADIADKPRYRPKRIWQSKGQGKNSNQGMERSLLKMMRALYSSSKR
jgi:hypothetical protein